MVQIDRKQRVSRKNMGEIRNSLIRLYLKMIQPIASHYFFERPMAVHGALCSLTINTCWFFGKSSQHRYVPFGERLEAS